MLGESCVGYVFSLVELMLWECMYFVCFCVMVRDFIYGCNICFFSVECMKLFRFIVFVLLVVVLFFVGIVLVFVISDGEEGSEFYLFMGVYKFGYLMLFGVGGNGCGVIFIDLYWGIIVGYCLKNNLVYVDFFVGWIV